MRVRRVTTIASALVLSLAILALTPGTASAWWHHHHNRMNDDAAAGYAVPIQAVYQFPAVQVNQPGVNVPFAPPVSLHIWIGDHHVLNR
jgi:hypothetical protein